MNPTEPLSLVRELHQALLDGDWGRFMIGLSPEVVWWAAGPERLLPWAGSYRGPEGVQRHFEILQANLVFERLEAAAYFEAGDVIVQLIEVRGHNLATERAFGGELVRIWTVKEGLVTYVSTHYDTAAFLLTMPVG